MTEFIVFSVDRQRYVYFVDSFDGDTEYTPRREEARIFRGETWREFWDRPAYRMEGVADGDIES